MFLFVLCVLGPCLSTGSPRSDVTSEQIALLNYSLDALHEEVAAARAPSAWPFLLFLLSILLPLVSAIWLLLRAERSHQAVHLWCTDGARGLILKIQRVARCRQGQSIANVDAAGDYALRGRSRNFGKGSSIGTGGESLPLRSTKLAPCERFGPLIGVLSIDYGRAPAHQLADD
jgi:hypothetical protein